jgi:hypothetical protein
MAIVTVRRVALLAAIVAPLAVVSAGSSAHGGQAKKKAPQVYKNIKILKTVDADQVIPIMHKINDSLGVRCDFCHVIETGANGQHVGWEKDTKPMKGVAREMMVMTGKLISNEKILKKKASCFMCHHGHAEPDVDAPSGRPGGR